MIDANTHVCMRFNGKLEENCTWIKNKSQDENEKAVKGESNERSGMKMNVFRNYNIETKWNTFQNKMSSGQKVRMK